LSRLVFAVILSEVLSDVSFTVDLNDGDKEQLYQELLFYFGLVGGLNVCEALEAAWRDPYNKSEIAKFILAWLKRKAKKRDKAAIWVI